MKETKLKVIKSRPSFTVDANALREALELGWVERKTSIPILSNVLLQPHDKTLRIVTTDLDQAVVTEIDATLSKHKTHEAFTVPWRKLLDLLSKEDGPAVFTLLENEWAKVAVGGVDYKLIGMTPKNYPALPDAVKAFHKIPGESFTEMLAHTIFAISAEESRYTLNGAQFQFNNGSLRIAATDGHRLALEKREMNVKVKDTQNLIVPRNALLWLSKSKRIGANNVGISWEDLAATNPRIYFHLPHLRTVFSTRKLNGQFPNVEAVIPQKSKTNITAAFESAETVGNLLAKVARFADERSGAVRWHVNHNVTISAASTEAGESQANIPAVVTGTESGTEVHCGFSSTYMLEVLKIIGKHSFTVSIKDAQSALLLEVPDYPGFNHILMPMRI